MNSIKYWDVKLVTLKLTALIKFYSKQFFSLALILLMIGLWKWFTFSSETQRYKDREAFKADYRIYAFNLPEKMDFAGEPVPMHDFEVLERLDRELLVNTYWQSQTLLFFKRANRFFPVIEPILKRHGIPDDFKYLPLVESGFMNVVSPAGASGFWQFLEPTALEYGLEVNNEIDERYHVAKATEAACKYLKDAYKVFGSWTLAAASYNVGMGSLRRSQLRQGVDSYYDLHLNSETSRYVFRILAIKEIMENPQDYGIHVRNYQKYPPTRFRKVEVDTTINNWVDFAIQHDLNYKMLRYFNPWIRGYSFNNSPDKLYHVDIPISQPDSTLMQRLFAEERDEVILQHLQDSVAKIEKIIGEPFVHKVRKGENLAGIASMYEVSIIQIIDWNGLSESPLKDGQKIKIFR